MKQIIPVNRSDQSSVFINIFISFYIEINLQIYQKIKCSIDVISINKHVTSVILSE